MERTVAVLRRSLKQAEQRLTQQSRQTVTENGTLIRCGDRTHPWPTPLPLPWIHPALALRFLAASATASGARPSCSSSASSSSRSGSACWYVWRLHARHPSLPLASLPPVFTHVAATCSSGSRAWKPARELRSGGRGGGRAWTRRTGRLGEALVARVPRYRRAVGRPQREQWTHGTPKAPPKWLGLGCGRLGRPRAGRHAPTWSGCPHECPRPFGLRRTPRQCAAQWLGRAVAVGCGPASPGRPRTW